MRLLVLGGTRFLGRAVAEAAVASGHEVTLANRGETNPELLPEAERVRVDLAGDLAPLGEGRWDAAIDLDPTQLPRQTRRRAEALAGSVDRYVFTSTISVYSDVSQPAREDSPVLEPPDPEPEAFDVELYGALKVGSERAVREVFGERCAIVRPGLIGGPHDPTDRFTYWPRRLAEGGDVLAPGNPGSPVQVIDARDLGAWMVELADRGVAGVFNATGPAEPVTLGEVLERVAAAVGGDVRLVWTDEQRILDAGVVPFAELPLWVPGDEWSGLMRVDISRALAEGLTLRPLEETARDTLAWSVEAGEQRPTLSRSKERELLAG
ncbi:MAG TPA: NAD-dependent epimerase/dehydratase family protein [Gaiellaceae bacterium]|nr:NAD-dependent epimerase/dehydratase family protein [Gaiellaceae bacterium]